MSLLARDFIKEMHDPERKHRSNSFRPPKHLLEREHSTTSILNRVRNINPFNPENHPAQHEPVNLMDTSLARYSNSESAPMGEGQLMGNHARKTHSMSIQQGDDGGMEDIWLDTSGEGTHRSYPHKNPHDGTKKRQRLLFWTVIVVVTCLVTGVLIHRHAGSSSGGGSSNETVEAPALEAVEAPVLESSNEASETNTTTAAPTPRAEGGAGESNVEEHAQKTVSEALGEMTHEIHDIEQEEKEVKDEEQESQGDDAVEGILAGEEEALENEEGTILEEEDLLDGMENAQTQQELLVMEQEYLVLDEERENLGDQADILDEEAWGNEDIDELEDELEGLEQKEETLEDHQQILSQQEKDEFEKEQEEGGGRRRY